MDKYEQIVELTTGEKCEDLTNSFLDHCYNLLDELYNDAYNQGVFDNVIEPAKKAKRVFKVGERVVCEKFGQGRVSHVLKNPDLDYPVKVIFLVTTELYTRKGRYRKGFKTKKFDLKHI